MTQLDLSKRYLLARPIGGFNDMLVQLERAAEYAKRFDRVMILDTRFSGLQAQLETVFEWHDPDGPEVIMYTQEIGDQLNRIPSVFPPVLRHNILSYEVKWNRQAGTAMEMHSGQVLTFDMVRDYREGLLVHHQAGGGVIAYRTLKRLRLKTDVANEIVSRLLPLGVDYDAIHIRHSDYQTRYWQLLLLLRLVLRNRHVLICSDNAQVKRLARRILHRSTKLISVSDIPDLAGKPLHGTKQNDPLQLNLNMLTDLFSMALSRRLFFTGVAPQKHNQTFKSGLRLWYQSYSGFSVLAERLRSNPEVVVSLLQNNTMREPAELLRERRTESSDPVRQKQIQRQDKVLGILHKGIRDPKWLYLDSPLPDNVLSPHRLKGLYAQSAEDAASEG